MIFIPEYEEIKNNIAVSIFRPMHLSLIIRDLATLLGRHQLGMVAPGYWQVTHLHIRPIPATE
jgi:hypothetical protein